MSTMSGEMIIGQLADFQSGVVILVLFFLIFAANARLQKIGLFISLLNIWLMFRRNFGINFREEEKKRKRGGSRNIFNSVFQFGNFKYYVEFLRSKMWFIVENKSGKVNISCLKWEQKRYVLLKGQKVFKKLHMSVGNWWEEIYIYT